MSKHMTELERARAGKRAMSKDPMVRAADDMLEALRGFASSATCKTFNAECVQCRARAAIAKAEGRGP